MRKIIKNLFKIILPILYFLDKNSNTGFEAPVAVQGSDLILTKALDKENVDGPSSFAVNVRCRRKKLQKHALGNQRRNDASLKGNILYNIYS